MPKGYVILTEAIHDEEGMASYGSGLQRRHPGRLRAPEPGPPRPRVTDAVQRFSNVVDAVATG
jgi:hypothetical protein